MNTSLLLENTELCTDWIKSIGVMDLLSIVTIICVNDVVILSEHQHESRISFTVCPQLIFVDIVFQQKKRYQLALATASSPLFQFSLLILPFSLFYFNQKYYFTVTIQKNLVQLAKFRSSKCFCTLSYS